MEAGEAAAGCGRRVGAGFCRILPNFARFCRDARAAPQLLRKPKALSALPRFFGGNFFFCFFSGQTQSRRAGLGRFPALPLLLCLQHGLVRGFKPATEYFCCCQSFIFWDLSQHVRGHRDCHRAEALGFRFIL